MSLNVFLVIAPFAVMAFWSVFAWWHHKLGLEFQKGVDSADRARRDVETENRHLKRHLLDRITLPVTGSLEYVVDWTVYPLHIDLGRVSEVLTDGQVKVFRVTDKEALTGRIETLSIVSLVDHTED